MRFNLQIIRGGKDENKPKVYRHYDYTLVVLTLLLVCFGLIMVCSASSYTAVKYEVAATYYLKRQGIFALIGVGVMLFMGRLNYNWLKLYIGRFPLIFYGYIIAAALQVAILFAGESTNGSTRWLSIPIIGRFQPSEFSKIVIIVLVAQLVTRRLRIADTFGGYLGTLVFVVIIAGLVSIENLSTALVILVIATAIFFVASKRYIYFLGVGFLGAGAVIAGIMAAGYRARRIVQWLNVETEGYQILQGLYAICAGGWFGKGLGNSAQKLGYIPEVHTDMIFSIICEELGIVGVILLLTVYGLLLFRIYRVIINSTDLFGSLICVGVFVHIALQVILNIAVVTNTIPSTGVTLPFISYGGTSLMTILFEIGLVLSVSSHIEYEE